MSDLENKNKCYIIAGPTASGKTGLSLALAEGKLQNRAVIINADSLQIYKGLPLLTACPTLEEKQQTPHALFEELEPAVQCSVALWWERANQEIQKAWHENKTPIVVGGTGMYINALIKGLPNTPEVEKEWREKAQARLNDIGNEAFHKELSGFDKELADTLAVGDSQRMMRGWEVFHATGEKLSLWQKSEPKKQGFDIAFDYIQIMPEREFLYERCNARFDMMVQQGAVEEIENFIKIYGTPDFPVCKAIGFYELKSYLSGEKSLEEAVSLAKQKTRNYAKRQMTWQRNTMGATRLHGFVQRYVQIEKADLDLIDI